MLEPVTVALTKDNFWEYFAIYCNVISFAPYEDIIFGYSHADTTVMVTCGLIVDAEISDVTLTFSLLPSGQIWKRKSFGPFNLSVPSVSGIAETTEVISATSFFIQTTQIPNNIEIELVNVTGTITIYP